MVPFQQQQPGSEASLTKLDQFTKVRLRRADPGLRVVGNITKDAVRRRVVGNESNNIPGFSEGLQEYMYITSPVPLTFN